MRIGIDATSLPPALAGAGRYIRGLINGIAGLDTRYEYVVFIKASDRQRFTHIDHPSMRFVTIPYSARPARLCWEMAGTPRVIARHALDVWHAPHYIAPLSPGRCKTVVTVHDMAFHLFPELYPRTKRMIFRRALAHAARTADRIIVTSRATGDEASQILGIDPARITVTHHGIDTLFRPVDDASVLADIQRRYRIDAPYILTVGTMDRRKNLPALLRIYDTLISRRRTDCVLVIAGQPGNGYDTLVRAIRTYGLQERVRLLGYVDEDDLPALYSGARLFVSTSRYEGFGFPPLEALACGAPVLASPVPSVTETTDGESIVTDPQDVHAWCDRIEALLAHPPSRADRLAAGRRLAARYTWTGAARQTLRVYEAAMDASGAVTPYIVRPPQPASASLNGALSHAALKTVVYADLFDYPLSADEIHQNLVACRASGEQVAEAMQELLFCGMLTEQDGWYALKGREELGRLRTRRSGYTAQLFQKNRWLLRALCACPFVRMAALSGAIAFENCDEDSDIDLFLIVDKERIWSAYTFLALMAKLIRKRDLLCMNYLITPDYRIQERDFYTAHQLANLQPLYGWIPFRRFTTVNGWVMSHLPQWNGHSNRKSDFAELRLSRTLTCAKQALELLLRLPVFNPVEWLVYTLYRRRLHRKTAGKPDCDVRLSRDRIKLHSNDHSRRIMDRFDRRLTEVMGRNERIGESANQRISESRRVV